MAHTMRSQTGMVLLLPCLCILLSLPDIFFLFLYDCSFSFSPFTVLLRVLATVCPLTALSNFLRWLFYKKTEVYLCFIGVNLQRNCFEINVFHWYTSRRKASKCWNFNDCTPFTGVWLLFLPVCLFLCSPSPLLFLFSFSTLHFVATVLQCNAMLWHCHAWRYSASSWSASALAFLRALHSLDRWVDAASLPIQSTASGR